MGRAQGSVGKGGKGQAATAKDSDAILDSRHHTRFDHLRRLPGEPERYGADLIIADRLAAHVEAPQYSERDECAVQWVAGGADLLAKFRAKIGVPVALPHHVLVRGMLHDYMAWQAKRQVAQALGMEG